MLDEASQVRRPVGGPATIRAKLNRLGEVAALPNVTLQVLDLDVGAHASMGTSFELLQFPGDSAVV